MTLYYGKCSLKFTRWSNNEPFARLVWELSKGKLLIYMLCDQQIDEQYYKSKLRYYRDVYDGDEQLGRLTYRDMPAYKVLKSGLIDPGDKYSERYHVIEVEDDKSLECILTFHNDDDSLHIFSSDYSTTDIITLFVDYNPYMGRVLLTDFILSNKKGLVEDKKICFIDTYIDDEDDKNSFVITSREHIYKKLFQVADKK